LAERTRIARGRVVIRQVGAFCGRAAVETRISSRLALA